MPGLGLSLVLVFFGSCMIVNAAPQNDNQLIIPTTSGHFRGYLDTNTTSVPLRKFLGVPFAQDTSGDNRWRPPQPVIPQLDEVFDATAYGPACLQGR